LARHGRQVGLHAGESSGGPRLVLNATTVQLVGRLFGEDVARWPEAHALRGRWVRWDAAEGERFFAEPAIAIASADLARRLRERVLGATDRITLVGADAETAPERTRPRTGERWIVAARGRGAAGASYRNWFRRSILSCEAACDAALSTAVTEATSAGWLFLFPHAPGAATLQAMVAHVAADPGAQLEAMLAETRLIAPLLRETPRAPAVARAAPRLRDELCRPGWIAVGDEALSLDPLCGDGTGYALREAIVAAAVVRRIDDGLPAAEALDHYRTRLQRTLAAHLRGCVAFYRDAPFAGAWEAELAAMERGRRALENAVAARPEAALHLRGFELIPADAAAF
jgi:hypothetical protein